MFANARFNQFETGDFAVSNARLFSLLKRLPPDVVRTGMRTAAWLETWVRWPLATLNLRDRVAQTLSAIDSGGERFGLTPDVKRRLTDYLLYDQTADTVTLMSILERERVREQRLKVRGGEVLGRACEEGPGVIVAGFRLGPYPAFPWALAAAAGGRPVLMIVTYERLADLGDRLGRTFFPSLNERVKFVASEDPRVLARATAVLKAGGVVATLLELSPVQFARKAPVDFLGWRPEVPYGISYLSAATGRAVIPAALVRSGRSALYRLELEAPIPAPPRNPEAVPEQTQTLYEILERRVLQAPSQWIGWFFLESNMGIQLPTTGGPPLAALS